MTGSISRQQALGLLHDKVKNEKMIWHSLASEAVMRALARRLGRDEVQWGLAGLLHDIDVEITGGDLSIHGLEAEKILSEEGIDPEIIEAIKMHNEESHGMKRESEFHHALAAGETITGLIIATALIYPDRKLEGVKAKSILKRMKEKAFAASVNRDIIRECELLGLELNEFVDISLDAMKGISGEIGL